MKTLVSRYLQYLCVHYFFLLSPATDFIARFPPLRSRYICCNHGVLETWKAYRTAEVQNQLRGSTLTINTEQTASWWNRIWH